MRKFRNRNTAGKILAKHLKSYAKKDGVIVIALPRGGVPVAHEIAKALAAPLDICIIRKLGVPGHKELAMGAIAMGDFIVFNQEIINGLNVPKAAIDAVIQAEKQELQRRNILYRGNRPFPTLFDKTIILIDDGVATGATIRAAIENLRAQRPKQIVVAVPVAAASVCEEITILVEQLICIVKPIDLCSVSEWYTDFSQTTDAEVCRLVSQDQAINNSLS